MFRLGSLSSLQRKGLSLLSLILLAESVSFSNAVKLSSTFETLMDNNNNNKNGGGTSFFKFKNILSTNTADDCLSSSGTCEGTASTATMNKNPLTKFLNPRWALSARGVVSPEDCCIKCTNCMDSSALKNCNIIPRGGHTAGAGTAGAAAETIAEALAGGGESGVTPYGIPLILWKVIFQVILTTINVACWLIPLRSKKISENKLGLSLANAFSGGVFLSLAFGHLIPECVHGFGEYQEAVPFMLVLSGYLLIFFVEKVAFDAHDILHEMESGADAGKNHEGKKDEVSSHGTGGRGAVILLGALAVHSILEMMALGLADKFGDCALLTLSIALHQPAESIALLVAFLKSGMPKDQIVKYLSVFSAMGPIGVALGIAVNEFAAPIVDSAMLAIVAGTFVYVGATEVIPEEWENSEHKWKKFAALMSGIVSIFAITQYTMTLGIH